jgi:hypothetical protein
MAARPISTRNDRRPIALHAQSTSIPEIVPFKVFIYIFELIRLRICFRVKILFYFNLIFLVEQLVIMKVQ